ncbi:MAG: sensor histidine kinase [Cyanobium sp.]|jgi:two-component system phosphate regulon sensor histidine kinase PhoR|nr:HAMP domain-containing sensor histidine kinase [Synechococcaceae cyanobacterium]
MLAFLGFLLGGLAGWLVARRLQGRPRPFPALPPSQLLGWVVEDPEGWLILDPANQVHVLNARAATLLQLASVIPPSRQPLDQLTSAPGLMELIGNCRQRQRGQRLTWQPGDEPLDLLALPGTAGWVAVRLQRRRSLEAQQRQQERWVSDVAHELKTPLTALLLVGDSLAAQVNSRNAVLVERLQRELRRLQQLVGDILELSRLENTLPGQGQSFSSVALTSLVEQVWGGLRPLADERAIRLRLAGDPAVSVQADPARLHRAILNLLDNAIRFSPDGGTVDVDISMSRGWCLLAVRDHGEGLSAQDLSHLFERFYRGDPARGRSRRGGSGLGLAIVQQIAITLGGRVQAANHPEGGALLELVLPMGS